MYNTTTTSLLISSQTYSERDELAFAFHDSHFFSFAIFLNKSKQHCCFLDLVYVLVNTSHQLITLTCFPIARLSISISGHKHIWKRISSRWLNWQISIQLNRWSYDWMNKLMDEQTNERTDGRTHECIYKSNEPKLKSKCGCGSIRMYVNYVIFRFSFHSFMVPGRVFVSLVHLPP